MIKTICLELESRKIELSQQKVKSLYFGGGTPSLINELELKEIFLAVHNNYDVSELSEVTLEANPDDIQVENLRAWKEIGINRLSIGIQSFREEDLKWMNRAHSVVEAETCIGLAREYGFDSFSVDLIYGLPNLTLKDWQENIQNVIDYGVSHISAYCLTVEEKTILAKKVENKQIIPSTEDEQAEQFEFLVAYLKKAGYEQYEVSNFCLPGKEAVHNSAYWKGISYVGVGPSAHSFNGSIRRFNVANNAQYMKLFEEGDAYFDFETLTTTQQFNEAILTGLRTKWGVSMHKLTSIQNPTVEFVRAKNEFVEKKWLKEENEYITLIGEGWLLADYIASELFLSD